MNEKQEYVLLSKPERFPPPTAIVVLFGVVMFMAGMLFYAGGIGDLRHVVYLVLGTLVYAAMFFYGRKIAMLVGGAWFDHVPAIRIVVTRKDDDRLEVDSVSVVNPRQ